MSNTVIQIKRSYVTNQPSANTLAEGELAYSYSSNISFIGGANGSIFPVGGAFYVGKTNSAYDIAIAAYSSANNVAPQVTPAFDTANAAYNQANAAYDAANTKLSLTGGNITGDIGITGNLNVTGNTSFISVDNYRVSDPLIYLAGNNYSSDIVDIGFIANYVNTTGQNVHTGLYREHEDKMYYLFQGYDQEPRNNHIGAMSNNMTLAVLNADLRTSNLSLGGVNAIGWITSSFNKANNALANTNGTLAGNLTVAGNFIATGNVTLGDAFTDTITINGTTISLGNNQTIDGSTLFIDATNNRVGIGNTNPSAPLDVSSSYTSSQARLIGSGIFNSDDTYGVIGIASRNGGNPDVQIGVYGSGRAVISGRSIGGYFTLGGSENLSIPSFNRSSNSSIIGALVADNGTLTDPIFIAQDSGNTVFTIVDGGRVGIGNSNPSHALSVNGSIHITQDDRLWSGSNNLRLGNYPQLFVSDTLQISGGQQSIVFGGTGAYATIGSTVPWDFVRGTTPQGIRIYGTSTDASNYERLSFSANVSGAFIQVQNAGTGVARPLYLGANNQNGILVTTNNRVRIGTSITSTTSAALLHVSDSGDAGALDDAHYSPSLNYQMVIGSAVTNADNPNAILLGSGSFGNNPVIRMKASNGAKGYVGWASSAAYFFVGTHDTKELRLRTNNQNRITISGDGNVGIGTTTPTSNLHVIGTANITGQTNIAGINVAPTIVASFDQANAAFNRANTGIFNSREINTNSTLTLNDYQVFANGNISISLVSASGNVGKQYTVTNISNSAVTLLPAGSDTIIGYSNMIIEQRWSSLTLTSTGTNWVIS